MNFSDALGARAAAIGAHLDGAMADLAPGDIRDGMRYAAEGGKRLRGFFVLEAAGLYGVPEDHAIWAASAIEAVHAYSLVHDDLPAMDDDALRRGRSTVHVKWDEATGILVGDALQSLAFDLVSRAPVSAEVRVALVGSLARAAGAMVMGQAMDIAAESRDVPLDLDEITKLQALKTGALIEWSVEAGAVLGRADPAPMRRYATALGLAFQIADDILDVEGDAATVGKAVRKDEGAGKATFVSLLGLDGAKARAAELVAEAETALSGFGAEADTLRAAARFVVARDR